MFQLEHTSRRIGVRGKIIGHQINSQLNGLSLSFSFLRHLSRSIQWTQWCGKRRLQPKEKETEFCITVAYFGREEEIDWIWNWKRKKIEIQYENILFNIYYFLRKKIYRNKFVLIKFMNKKTYISICVNRKKIKYNSIAFYNNNKNRYENM